MGASRVGGVIVAGARGAGGRGVARGALRGKAGATIVLDSSDQGATLPPRAGHAAGEIRLAVGPKTDEVKSRGAHSSRARTRSSRPRHRPGKRQGRGRNQGSTGRSWEQINDCPRCVAAGGGPPLGRKEIACDSGRARTQRPLSFSFYGRCPMGETSGPNWPLTYDEGGWRRSTSRWRGQAASAYRGRHSQDGRLNAFAQARRPAAVPVPRQPSM